MTRRMTDVLIAIVFAITLLGLAHTAKSGPTAETASKNKSNGELLQAIADLRNDVRELRHETDRLRGLLEEANKQNKTRAAQPVERAPTPAGDDPLVIEKLRQKVTWNFNKGTLIDFARELGERWNFNVVIEKKPLEESKIELTTPISLCAKDEMLGSALKRALAPLGLDFVAKNEVVLITASAKLEIRTYPVDDLVTSGSTVPTPKSNIDFEPIILLITTTTGSPWSWESGGGSGSVKILDRTLSLVIRQTPEIHERIGRLLQSLRDNGGWTVKLNATVIEHPSPDLFEKANLTKRNEKVSATSSLSENSATTLLKLAQEDPHANLIQPERMVANGRLTSINFKEISKQDASREMLVIAAALEGQEKDFGVLCYSLDPKTGQLVRRMTVIGMRNPKPSLIELKKIDGGGAHHDSDQSVYLLVRPKIVAR